MAYFSERGFTLRARAAAESVKETVLNSSRHLKEQVRDRIRFIRGFRLRHSTIDNQWDLGRCIHIGASVKVFEAGNRASGDHVIVKIGRDRHNRLRDEYNKYEYLCLTGENDSPTGFPKVFHYGQYGQERVMVMSHVGENLEDMMKTVKSFSLDVTLFIGLQILDRLEFLHRWGIVHRDINPSNVFCRSGNSRIIYLVDFGSADYIAEVHTERKTSLGHRRTVMFASVSWHEGRVLSKRDDLESLGYVLVYLYYGSLPWPQTSNLKKIENYKKRTTVQDLSHRMPPEFTEYLDRVLNLGHNEEPDYPSLRILLQTAHDSILRL